MDFCCAESSTSIPAALLFSIGGAMVAFGLWEVYRTYKAGGRNTQATTFPGSAIGAFIAGSIALVWGLVDVLSK